MSHSAVLVISNLFSQLFIYQPNERAGIGNITDEQTIHFCSRDFIGLCPWRNLYLIYRSYLYVRGSYVANLLFVCVYSGTRRFVILRFELFPDGRARYRGEKGKCPVSNIRTVFYKVLPFRLVAIVVRLDEAKVRVQMSIDVSTHINMISVVGFPA